MFSLLFVVNAQKPVLQSVSIDTIFPQQITVSWQYDASIDSVTIYRCTRNCHIEEYFNRIAKIEMSDLAYIDEDTVASPMLQIMYCIGWKESGKSEAQNNMVLKSLPSTDGCQNSISLSWNPYINMLDTLDYYNIFYRKNEIDTSFFVRLDSTKETNYTAKLLENETVYDFVIQAINKTKTISAFSNIVTDTTGTVIDEPVDVRITRVSVLDDSFIEIDVETDGFFDPLNVVNLYLLRGMRGNSAITFNRIDSLPYNSKNEYFFTDEDVDPLSELYYYQVAVTHQCKSEDKSNILTNILLKGNRVEKENYKDQITFSQFGDIIPETYELLVNEKIFSTDFPLTMNNNVYIVGVKKLINESSEIVYQMRSDKNEYSNTIIIPHEPVVYFTNAFFPNGLDEDKTFYPIIDFASDEAYHFYIYNRWGQELFHAIESPKNGECNEKTCWYGTFNGQECPAGIYVYKLSYSYNNSKNKFSTSGSVMLLR